MEISEMLANVRNDAVTHKTQLKLKVAALTLKDCDIAPILRKYFKANNKLLDRFHIPEISAERYAEIAAKFKRTSRFNEANLKMDTASDYYIRKARVQNVAEELGVSPNFIDTTDYVWDENFYTAFSTMRQIDELDDAWKLNEDDSRYWSANKVYIECDPKHNVVDYELYDSLYHFCYTAIVNRKAMLLCKVDKCLSFLHRLAEYTNGFAENATSAHMATLRSYMSFFIETLSDKDAVAWLANTNDVKVFGNNEALHNDYVDTYRTMLKGIVRGGDIESFRQILSKVEDPYIDEILTDIETETLSESYLKDVEA